LYLYDGRCSGQFERAITLPAAVATDGVRAELMDGILSLSLPKSPEAKPRKIAFKACSRRVERALAKVAAALVTMALVLLAAVGTAS
jgi:Hsp20/alpha crystallin family